MEEQKLFEQIVRSLNVSDIDSYLNPKYSSLADPMLLPDIELAVDRLKKAKVLDQTVGVYGDYDIDGMSAAALLDTAFDSFGIKRVVHIPDRLLDDFGIDNSGVDALVKRGAQLIVTVDCGTSSEPAIAYAKTLGIDVIVTDHHQVNELPKSALAVVNPHRNDSLYPFNDRSGVGVAFGLVQALQTKLNGLEKGQEKWLLDYVSLGTMGDVVSLKGENRILVHYGLQVLARTSRPGLKALTVASTKGRLLNEESISFGLAPWLNSGARLGQAQLSYDLLTAKNERDADILVEKLYQLNESRKQQQQAAIKLAEDQLKDSKHKVVVLADKDWSPGLNGLVASSISDSFKRPAFILQIQSDGTAKGSGRSFGGFDIAAALEGAADMLIAGGGHPAAGGLTIKTANIDKFRDWLDANFDKYVGSDSGGHKKVNQSDLSCMNLELIRLLDQLRPFGQDNPKPIFEITDLKVLENRPVGSNGDHFKLGLQDINGLIIGGIAFFMGPAFKNIQKGDTISINTFLESNDFNGKVSPQLQVLSLLGVAPQENLG